MKKPLNLALAVVVLLVALAMAAVAAWQRADATVDRLLMVALACVTVAAVHLLPALTKRRIVWPLWAGCFVVAIYGHAGFFVFASTKLGEARESRSAQSTATIRHRESIEASLATIKARPLAMVAAQVLRTQDGDKLAALHIELDEAKRIANLRDELVRLDASAASNAVTGYVTDPVTFQVATMMDISERTVMLILNLSMAALIELVGMVLWLELVKPKNVASNPESNASNLESNAQIEGPLSPIDCLRSAVKLGQCKPTVAGIRRFMECGQVRAMHMRREL